MGNSLLAVRDIDHKYIVVERSTLFSYHKQTYMIFSKTGFTERLEKIAQQEKDIRLISFKDMCEVMR